MEWHPTIYLGEYPSSWDGEKWEQCHFRSPDSVGCLKISWNHLWATKKLSAYHCCLSNYSLTEPLHYICCLLLYGSHHRSKVRAVAYHRVGQTNFRHRPHHCRCFAGTQIIDLIVGSLRALQNGMGLKDLKGGLVTLTHILVEAKCIFCGVGDGVFVVYVRMVG